MGQSPLPTQIPVKDENKKLPEVMAIEPEVINIKPDKILFDFPTAMKEVAEGKRISKEDWKDANIYGEMKDDKLIIYMNNKVNYWIITTADLEGKDWYVL